MASTPHPAPAGTKPRHGYAHRSRSDRRFSWLSPPFEVSDAAALFHQLHQQWRRLPVHRPEARTVALHALEQRREPNGLRVKHGTATIARKAVTCGPHDIDVTRPLSDTLFQNAKAFVHERIQAALEDLLFAVRL